MVDHEVLGRDVSEAPPSSCALCGESASISELWPKVSGSDTHKMFSCSVCTVQFLWPKLTREEQTTFYRDEYTKVLSGRQGIDNHEITAEMIRMRDSLAGRERLAVISRVIGQASRILEVGCGSGFLAELLAGQGHEYIAVEPSGIFMDDIRRRGFEVHASQEDFAESDESGVDLVVHFFVLEHVNDPVSFLRSQLRLLRPGGSILFQVPASSDPLLRLFPTRAFKDFYYQVAHQWVFSKEAIDWLGGELGVCFDTALVQRYGLSNHLRWLMAASPGGDPVLSEIIGDEVDEAYRSQIVKAGFGDSLFVTVRKSEISE